MLTSDLTKKIGRHWMVGLWRWDIIKILVFSLGNWMVSQKNEFCSLLVRIWLKIVRQLISTLFENIFCSKYKKTCSKWDYSRVTSGIPPSAMGLFSLGEIQNSCAKLNFPSGKQPHSLGGYHPRCHTRKPHFSQFFCIFHRIFFKQCGK